MLGFYSATRTPKMARWTTRCSPSVCRCVSLSANVMPTRARCPSGPQVTTQSEAGRTTKMPGANGLRDRLRRNLHRVERSSNDRTGYDPPRCNVRRVPRKLRTFPSKQVKAFQTRMPRKRSMARHWPLSPTSAGCESSECTQNRAPSSQTSSNAGGAPKHIRAYATGACRCRACGNTVGN